MILIPEDVPQNLQIIQEIRDAVRGPVCTVNLFLDSVQDARQYAHDHPDRSVYWIQSIGVAAWITPLRRATDTAPRA